MVDCMTDQIIKTIKEDLRIFLDRHRQTTLPLLVGFSGGPDSLALVHLLQDLNCEMHLAHFDHGWRAKSQEQVQRMAAFAATLRVPFHTMRAKRPDTTENGARNQRWDFFKKIFRYGSFEAIALAHHLEDQAETVLKRLLEGAHLHNLRGMQSVIFKDGIPTWRPLMGYFKADLATVIRLKEEIPIEDATNGDRRYLRARIRKEIFPHLTASFGKNVAAPLARLGHKGQQLSHYLEIQTKHRVLQQEERGPYYDLTGAHPVEVDFVLSRSPFPTPSRHTLQIIHRAIENHGVRVRASHQIIVDRGRVIWTKVSQMFVN